MHLEKVEWYLLYNVTYSLQCVQLAAVQSALVATLKNLC